MNAPMAFRVSLAACNYLFMSCFRVRLLRRAISVVVLLMARTLPLSTSCVHYCGARWLLAFLGRCLDSETHNKSTRGQTSWWEHMRSAQDRYRTHLVLWQPETFVQHCERVTSSPLRAQRSAFDKYSFNRLSAPAL